MALFGGVAWGKAPAPEASLSGLNSMDPEKKRKFDGKRNPHERERVIQIGQQQLERVIKFTVEKAVQPLCEELTQIKKLLHKKEKDVKKQEDKKGEDKKTKIKATKQSYSQVLQEGTQEGDKSGWTTVAGKKKTKKFPIKQRRLLFKLGGEQGQRQQPQDLLLLANQVLRNEKAEGISFIQLSYTPTGQISAVLNKSANRDMVEPLLSAVQRAFQERKVPVLSAGAVETWAKLRVHLVPTERYLQPGGLDLARKEIETTLGFQLPTAVRWLKTAEAIRENQGKGSKYTSVMVTVPNADVAKRLKAQGLYFRGKKHPVEDFHDSSREVCPDCCQIGHKKGCTSPPKCFLCAGNHHCRSHHCEACDSGKPCKHLPLKCANCKGKHEAVNPICLVARAKRVDTQQRAVPPQTQMPGSRSSKIVSPTLPVTPTRMEVDASTLERNEGIKDKMPEGKELEKGQKQQEGRESKQKAKSEQEKAPVKDLVPVRPRALAPVEALAPQQRRLKPTTRHTVQTLAEKEKEDYDPRIFTFRMEYTRHTPQASMREERKEGGRRMERT